MRDRPETTVLEARYFNTGCKVSHWVAIEINMKCSNYKSVSNVPNLVKSVKQTMCRAACECIKHQLVRVVRLLNLWSSSKDLWLRYRGVLAGTTMFHVT